MRLPSGLVMVVVPSGLRVMVQPHRWTTIRWWKVQSKDQFGEPGAAAFAAGGGVVHVAGGGGLVAAGGGAVPVAEDDGAAQVGRDGVGGGAEVQRAG